MGVSDILSRKSGVIVYVSASSSSPMQTAADDICSGDDVRKLFKYYQEKNFAIPAINVISSISVERNPEREFGLGSRTHYLPI
jgi:hypothetical protein